MKNIVEVVNKENFDSFMQAKDKKLADEMFLKFQEVGVESEEFKRLLKGGYKECIMNLITQPDSLEIILAIRVLVGMSIGFQYAQALYEQKELELLVK